MASQRKRNAHRSPVRSGIKVLQDLDNLMVQDPRTQEKIMSKAGLVSHTYSAWKRGDISPTISNLEAVSQVLGYQLVLKPLEASVRKYNAPTGSPIVGTREVIEGTCGILGIDPKTGEPEYDSTGTQIDWDSQKTKTNYRGEILFIDEDGRTWSFSELVLAPEEEEEIDG